ncbi:MAG: rRNA pseudouridine synthase [Clostridiales bacterium]|nr:rRNA pseudouridine synthase [Clostridiales bacterium]
MSQGNEIRLQKYMADCGVASRRASEQLIKDGKVKINGRRAKLGDKINKSRDTVMVEGKRLEGAEKQLTIMLNKPRGYVTTVSDELGRKTVMQLVSGIDERIYPVGRLDKDSQGLLIMTNDGALANFLTHPSNGIKKRYSVTIKGSADEAVIQHLRDGVVIDGKKTAKCEVEIISTQKDRQQLDFTLSEGRNREIRKMCETLGLEVMRLKRISVGDLKLGQLPVGKWRRLSDAEIRLLKKSHAANNNLGKKRYAAQG